MKKFAVLAATGMMVASFALPVFAESSTGMMTKEHSSTKPKVDGSCMASAVTKRDAAISAALGPVVTALNKRGADEAAAWTAMDKTALATAKKNFEGTWKTFETTRKAAWTTFKTDAKACKVVPGITNTDVPSPTTGL